MIELKNISKTFKVAKRNAGFKEAFKAFFRREYEYIHALKNISFTINDGEMVGYIGPNGAGKSSTIKVMSGILNPDSGECIINGKIPWKDRIKHVNEIGVVFGQRSQLWWDVPVIDSFDLLKDIYNVPVTSFKERLNRLTEAMDIGEIIKTPVRQLSLGQRMRCEVVAALLHSPKILFLDEPTIGLDAVSKLALREFLRNENKQNGVRMILTTHDMDDIEALCEKVMVIGRGEILFNGNLVDLKHHFSPLKQINAVTSSPAELINIAGAVKIECKDNTFTVWFDPQKVPAQKIIADIAKQLPLVDITIKEQDIDEMIAMMYKEMNL